MLYNRHSVQILTSIPMLFVLVFKLNVASMENVVVFFRTATGSISVQLFIMPECIWPTDNGEQWTTKEMDRQTWSKQRETEKGKTASSQACVDNDSDYIILDATKIQRIWKMPDVVKFSSFHIDTGIVRCIFSLVNRYQKQCKTSGDYLRIANNFILIICTVNIERDGCQCNSIIVFAECRGSNEM